MGKCCPSLNRSYVREDGWLNLSDKLCICCTIVVMKWFVLCKQNAKVDRVSICLLKTSIFYPIQNSR